MPINIQLIITRRSLLLLRQLHVVSKDQGPVFGKRSDEVQFYFWHRSDRWACAMRGFGSTS